MKRVPFTPPRLNSPCWRLPTAYGGAATIWRGVGNAKAQDALNNKRRNDTKVVVAKAMSVKMNVGRGGRGVQTARARWEKRRGKSVVDSR